MRVGFDAPLPPVRSGVADYAAALLGALRNFGEVQVVPRRADVWLYHMGNNQLHRETYRRAMARPGVVVLHDAVLQHFFLGAGDGTAYIEEFVYNYGEWSRELAGEMWRGRAASGPGERYFRYPMLRRIAERARAVVVHNAAAARMVREHAPEAKVVIIPHLCRCEQGPSVGEAMRFRQRHGLPPGGFVFGIFGYLREAKRLMPVLRVFERVRRARPGAALLVAGDFVSSDLARAAEPWLAQPGVVRLPFLTEGEFLHAAAAVDACVNLRYPAAGETSGITVRMMGIGKPVLVTAAPENDGYPELACMRVEAGPGEEESLWHHMVLLLSSAELRQELGRQAAAHIALHHSVEAVAEQYWNTLCEYRC